MNLYIDHKLQAWVCFGLTAPKGEPKVPQEGKLSLQVGDCPVVSMGPPEPQKRQVASIIYS